MTNNRLAQTKRITSYIVFLFILFSVNSAFGMLSAPCMENWGTATEAILNSCSDDHWDQGKLSSYSIESNDIARVEAFADLRADGIMPVLQTKTETIKLDSIPVSVDYSAWAFAVEGYRYLGDDSDITLTATLTGTGGGTSSASVYIFNEPHFSFSPSTDFLVNYCGATYKDSLDLALTGSGQDVDSFSFDVTTGETFYLWVALDSIGNTDSNLSVTFDNYSDLSAMSSSVSSCNPAVPIPGSVFLLVSGMACVVGFGRRYKRD